MDIYDIANDMWSIAISLPDSAMSTFMRQAKTVGNHVYFAHSQSVMAIYRPEMSDAEKWEVKTITTPGGMAFIDVGKLEKKMP